MKSMMLDEIIPYLFHMNWNTDVATKKKFSQQIGAWFIRGDDCLHETTKNLAISCCVAKPSPVCFYRDKPSKMRSCKDYPAIESDKSFW
jgi:hypothetical protein